MLASQLIPTAIDVLDAPAARMMRLEGEGAALAVRCEGPAAAIARMVRDVGALASAHGATELGEADGPTTEAMWARIADFARVVDLSGDDEAVLKLSVIPTDVADVLSDLAEAGDRLGLSVARLAHAGVGIVLARVRPAEGGDKPFGPALAELQTGLVQRWKNAVVLGCAARYKPGLPLWGAEPSGIGVMRALKQEYDPNGILNKGRFVGGI
jgi:glycolate oxidase FAD binding subunit